MSYTAQASVIVNASVQEVWDAMTKAEMVKKYFFGTDLDTSWEVGSPIFFRGVWEGKQYEDKGTVTEFNPPHTASYTYFSPLSGKEDKEENYQILKYIVEETPEGTKATIEQSNAATQKDADHSTQNWTMVLNEMKKLVEGK